MLYFRIVYFPELMWCSSYLQYWCCILDMWIAKHSINGKCRWYKRHVLWKLMWLTYFYTRQHSADFRISWKLLRHWIGCMCGVQSDKYTSIIYFLFGLRRNRFSPAIWIYRYIVGRLSKFWKLRWYFSRNRVVELCRIAPRKSDVSHTHRPSSNS